MNNSTLRHYIREEISNLLAEADEVKFFIRYSAKNATFLLYKRFFDYDDDFNRVEKVIVVDELDPNPKKAEIEAKKITGQDLQAKKPAKATPLKRGELIMPVSTYKGKKLKEIPLDYLVSFIQHNKWMNLVDKDPYVLNVYEYLTQDLLSQTKAYLLKQIKGTSTPVLATKYNEYKKYNYNPEYNPNVEKMVFANILMPLMKSELLERMVLFADDGTAIIPK